MSVGSSQASMEIEDKEEVDGSRLETRSSTLTSVWVAEGGRERRTVRKVSWRRTACQTFRRCCLMNRGAVGTTEWEEDG